MSDTVPGNGLNGSRSDVCLRTGIDLKNCDQPLARISSAKRAAVMKKHLSCVTIRHLSLEICRRDTWRFVSMCAVGAIGAVGGSHPSSPDGLESPERRVRSNASATIERHHNRFRIERNFQMQFQMRLFEKFQKCGERLCLNKSRVENEKYYKCYLQKE